MCFWPVAEVELEDAPPKKKTTKKEEAKPDYVLVSDQLNLQPTVSASLVNTSLLFLCTTPRPQPRHFLASVSSSGHPSASPQTGLSPRIKIFA